MKNAQYFTKLDLNAVSHQLEFDERSRYITAFQTEDRIKRFKRLTFGLNSASEQLQHHLKTLLADISGVIDIADDILVFASTIAEHDLILQRVLQRLSENGLLLNLEKYLVSKETLGYFGFVFSKNGMKPSVSNILALKEAKRTQDIKGVCGYLVITNYSKLFIPYFSKLTYPIRKVTHQSIKFEWSDGCEKSYLTERAVNTYFDERKALLFTVMHLLSDYSQFYCKRTKTTMLTLYLIHLVL